MEGESRALTALGKSDSGGAVPGAPAGPLLSDRGAPERREGGMLDERHGRATRRARLPPPLATACDFVAAQEKGKESSGSSSLAWSSSPRSSRLRGRKWGENWVDGWRARKNGSHLRLLCALQYLI
jgi:hypothetical protein